jgi:hypothetical protein
MEWPFMVAVRHRSFLWYLFRAPVYLYRWHLGWLFGHRCLLLAHTGRRSGLRRQNVLGAPGSAFCWPNLGLS